MERDSDFEMTVTAVYTITGRGLVVCGVPARGAIHTGDKVRVRHGQEETVVTCGGIEMIHFVRDADVDRRTIGVVVPELQRHQVDEGDVITVLPSEE